ncbi:MAG: flap endonuclease-1 [Thermoproteota archaeon]
MGVKLKLLTIQKDVKVEDMRGKSFAVDANNILHQFLASIRNRDGSLLRDSEGHVTSHLIGLLFRYTRLIADYHVRLIFVFDGKPPKVKQQEMKKRKQMRQKARQEWREALRKEQYTVARSKAMRSGRLTLPRLEDAKKLLNLLGIPCLQAPSEAEAQIAYMTRKGDTWAANSRDYDTLLFGSPRLARYLKASAQETKIIELEETLTQHGITRGQLVDIAILMGTDYNPGVRGIGPKTGLKLIKEYGRIEKLPLDVYSEVTEQYKTLRQIFLKPEVTMNYSLSQKKLKEERVIHFLCDQRELSRKRIENAVKKIKNEILNRRPTK